MKRDMDLIRKIMLTAESCKTGFLHRQEFAFDGYSPEQVAYHCYLLVEAGLANGVDVTVQVSTTPEYELTYLTWAGHEFIDAAKDDTRWHKAMKRAKESGGSLTFAALQSLLNHLLQQALGLLGP